MCRPLPKHAVKYTPPPLPRPAYLTCVQAPEFHPGDARLQGVARGERAKRRETQIREMSEKEQRNWLRATGGKYGVVGGGKRGHPRPEAQTERGRAHGRANIFPPRIDIERIVEVPLVPVAEGCPACNTAAAVANNDVNPPHALLGIRLHARPFEASPPAAVPLQGCQYGLHQHSPSV